MISIKKMNRETMKFENNLYSQRLLPWPELNSPFQGAWCVIEPNSSSTLHKHHEYEIFIAIKGQAYILSNDERILFNTGDIVYFPPYIEHSIINESKEPFEMYSIWWDYELTMKFQEKIHSI